jgi:hypothetical protein
MVSPAGAPNSYDWRLRRFNPCSQNFYKVVIVDVDLGDVGFGLIFEIREFLGREQGLSLYEGTFNAKQTV